MSTGRNEHTPHTWRPPHEEELLRTILERCPTNNLPVGAGQDDAAVLPNRLVLNVDTMTRSRHIPRELNPKDLGWKFVAATISDVGAMGARPRHFAFSITRDGKLEENPLIDGIARALRHHDLTLIGGDIVDGEEFSLTGVALGELPGKPLRVDRARPGDVIAVTGPLGGPNAYVQAILNDLQPPKELYRAFARPEPPIHLGIKLSQRNARAAVTDISDGLLADAEIIARRSEVKLVIEAERVPVHPRVEDVATELDRDPLDVALEGGEDFEYLVCAPEELAEELDLTVIGRVEPGPGTVEVEE
ncbi:MAG: thiamine-phosphate kinase [Euryarchaeota archaeon]